MSRRRIGKHIQRRLIDQEILEWFLKRFTIPSLLVAKERKNFLKFPFIGTLGACFSSLLPLIAWLGVVPFWYWGIPIALNAILLSIFGIYGYFTSKRIEKSIPQEQLVHFMAMSGLLSVSWIGFYSSLMALLASIGCWVQIAGAPWWIPALIYGAGGVGLWVGRKALLRAIVEGPEAHPWFWPIRLFFATTLGFCIFLTAVERIILGWAEQVNVNIGLLFLAASGLGLSILLLGMAMTGGIIGYLHYQRWLGAKELRI